MSEFANLRSDKAFFNIGMNLAGRFAGCGILSDRPRSDLILTGSQKRYQP
jgi:hypothetical protein